MKESKLNGKQIVDHCKGMRNKRSSLTSLFEQVDRYFQPNLNNFYNDNRQMLGTSSDTHVLNRFASRAADRVVNTLYSVVMNVDTSFFSLMPKDVTKEIKKQDEVCLEAMQNSNLSVVAMSAFKEIVHYGSASVYPSFDKKTNKLVYTLLPRANSYFETDYNNTPYINSMAETCSAASLVREYGSLVSSEVLTASRGDLSKAHEVNIKVWRYFTDDAMYVVEEETNHIIMTFKLSSPPIATGRWNHTVNDYYGISMAVKSLTDVVFLQTMEKQILTQTQLAIKPPIIMPYDTTAMSDGLIFDRDPEGVIEYRRGIDGSSDVPQALQIAGDINIGLINVEKTEQAISSNFFLDILQFALQANAQTTATQINAGGSEKVDIILGLVVALIHDFVEPLVERSVQLLFDNDMLEPIDGDYNVEVHSSLLVKAKEIKAKRSLTAFDTLAQMAQMDPSIMDNINMDELSRDFLLNSQIKSNLIRSKQEVKKIRGEKKQAMDEQTQGDEERQLSQQLALQEAKQN